MERSIIIVFHAMVFLVYCTYSDSQCCSVSAGQCAGGGYHGNGVGGPCNQSNDGGSSGSSLRTL